MPAKIDYHRCTGCKKCYDLCPIDVFTWDEEMNIHNDVIAKCLRRLFCLYSVPVLAYYRHTVANRR